MSSWSGTPRNYVKSYVLCILDLRGIKKFSGILYTRICHSAISTKNGQHFPSQVTSIKDKGKTKELGHLVVNK
uniref:Putative ovule protein n=1 Tax=Solanum chacoense TaxID=4108 RepID=A0A0V0HID6_SOLCH